MEELSIDEPELNYITKWNHFISSICLSARASLLGFHGSFLFCQNCAEERREHCTGKCCLSRRRKEKTEGMWLLFLLHSFLHQEFSEVWAGGFLLLGFFPLHLGRTRRPVLVLLFAAWNCTAAQIEFKRNHRPQRNSSPTKPCLIL